MARRKAKTDEATFLGSADAQTLLDTLAAQIKTPAEFQVLYRQFQKALTERVLKAELTHHLGYPEGGSAVSMVTRAMARRRRRSTPIPGVWRSTFRAIGVARLRRSLSRRACGACRALTRPSCCSTRADRRRANYKRISKSAIKSTSRRI